MAIDDNKPGAPTKYIGQHRQMQPYMKDIAIQFLDLVAEGKTVKEIAELPNMPTRQTLYRWLSLYSDFNSAYFAAKELSAMALEEEALEIARDLAKPNEYTGTRITALKEAMVQFRWSAARRDPKRYGGAAPQTNVTVPIQINTNLDLNKEGNDEAQNGYSFTAVVPVGEGEAEETGDFGDSPCYDPNEDVDVTAEDPYNAPDEVPAWQARRPPKKGPKHKNKGLIPMSKLGPRQAAARRARMAAKRQAKAENKE